MAFSFQLAAAPIAGISTRTYRDIVRSMGADLPYGEMISARALVYGNKKTFELLDLAEELSPKVVQLFGSEPSFMREAAEIVKAAGADYLDINMGCPVPKIVRNNEGSALMRNPCLAASLVQAVAAAGLPVSVKFRSGWDNQNSNALEFAQAMEQAGAAFIAVHGRTREQFYSGQADWQVIRSIKAKLVIPVIGNGDIFCAADALRMKEETGCDAVMVGRGMLGNPWLFADIKAAFAGEEQTGRPPGAAIVEQALAHLGSQIDRAAIWLAQREKLEDIAVRKLAEELAIKSMRTHLGWYIKGLRHARDLRREINSLDTYQQIAEAFSRYLEGSLITAAADEG